MRIGLVKPDYGITGGFELVVAEIERGLEQRGAVVDRVRVDVRTLDHAPFGVNVGDALWRRSPAWFDHLRQVEAFLAIDLSRFDVVLSTQPPSYAVRHPRQVSVFYHHLRQFYDLADAAVAAGLHAPAIHRHAIARLRPLDQLLLDRVGWFLAGSETVARRLATFNGITENVDVFHAGLGFRSVLPDDPGGPGSGTLCVSRHEFPKRTELFVAAAHVAATPGWSSIGTGGRLPWARELDSRFAQRLADAAGDDHGQWWGGRGEPLGGARGEGVVCFHGAVDRQALDRAFRDCRSVVAPALDEDYGLTALEAMAYSRPVVVCSDGGNLRELVEQSGAGLVVAPQPAAIAEGVDRLAADDELAAELGHRGREFAATFTWARAIDEVEAAIAKVLA